MQSAMRALLALLFVTSAAATVTVGQDSAENAANPIRKVVTMLQMMQKKIVAEGEKEEELFEKFMCYCKTSGSTLGKSIADAGVKIPALQTDIEEAEAQKAQFEEDVKSHQTDRAAAKEAIAEATQIREKEAAAFAAASSEYKANVGAMTKAIDAITTGMAGGFLQTSAAATIKKIALTSQDLLEADRQDLLAFLGEGQGQGYVPQSGQIVGILKQLKDEMAKGLAEIEEAEKEAVKSYEELMAAKKKEIEALTRAIEEKLERIGQLGVEIAMMKNELTDAEEALVEDTKFLANLKENCATKEKEWDEVKKTRAEELLAIAETIKILNDDDALELFKKTLPSPSLLQLDVSKAAAREQALTAILSLRPATGPGRPQIDLIAMALRGKKIGFEKVIKMIDEMVASLKKEQVDDDSKQEYCEKQFDVADDKEKALKQTIEDIETAISVDKDTIATLKTDIKALEDGIKALDKAVAEATDQRKEEHEDFTELMASNSAAKELLLFAKNRLQKFYNPKLYKSPPKRTLSEEERVTVNMGGTLAPTAAPGGIAGTGISLAQIGEHNNGHRVAPPPPPEAVGAYQKKSEESGGVLAMMDMLVKDLDKEMTVAETEEKDAQEDYEQMMRDSAGKRAEDSKAIVEKQAAKAESEGDLESQTEAKKSTTKELAATLDYISSLHAECDWLLKFYEVRKEARASEIDALGKAKAVLSGADFSLVQTKLAARSLRGH